MCENARTFNEEDSQIYGDADASHVFVDQFLQIQGKFFLFLLFVNQCSNKYLTLQLLSCRHRRLRYLPDALRLFTPLSRPSFLWPAQAACLAFRHSSLQHEIVAHSIYG